MANIKKKALLLLLCSLLFCGYFFPFVTLLKAETALIDYDKTSVMADLTTATVNGKPFNLSEYPLDKSGLKTPKLITFSEYCFTFNEDYSEYYGLYVYFYNPSGQLLTAESLSNKVQMAVSYKDGLPEDYKKFDLSFCSKSDGELENVFYKFKILGTEELLTAVKENVRKQQEYGVALEHCIRRYDISGLELIESGQQTATEYKVGGTYKYSGFASYLNLNNSKDSTLNCAVNELETVDLKVKSTNYRSGVSAQGKNHQNDLSSVYFTVPNELLEKYGKLQKIKAEWFEYKTEPIVILENKSAFDTMNNYVGHIINGSYDTNIPVLISDDFEMSGDLKVYDWMYNGYWKNSYSGGALASNSYSSALYNLFYSEGTSAKDYILSSKKLTDYIYSYDKSFHGGRLPLKSQSISADLFMNGGKTVDSGRSAGYNSHMIDSDDTFDMLSYDSTHNWWDKLMDYGFFAPVTSEEFKDVRPIYEVTDEDLQYSDLSKHLLISSADVDDFKNTYNSAKLKGDKTFLFRFALTDYYSLSIENYHPPKNKDRTKGYMAQETVFMDFDIVSLTFNREGAYTVIAAVSSPIDIINDITPPLKDVIPWWVWLIIGVVLLLILIIFLPNVLVFLFKAVWYVLMFPIQFIVWFFQTVFGK